MELLGYDSDFLSCFVQNGLDDVELIERSLRLCVEDFALELELIDHFYRFAAGIEILAGPGQLGDCFWIWRSCTCSLYELLVTGQLQPDKLRAHYAAQCDQPLHLQLAKARLSREKVERQKLKR